MGSPRARGPVERLALQLRSVQFLGAHGRTEAARVGAMFRQPAPPNTDGGLRTD